MPFLLIPAQVGLPSDDKSEGTAGIVSLHGKLFARMENKKKQKQKFTAKPIKKKYQENCKSTIEIFLKMRKLKREIMPTLEKHFFEPLTEKEKCYIWKFIAMKEKNVEWFY